MKSKFVKVFKIIFGILLAFFVLFLFFKLISYGIDLYYKRQINNTKWLKSHISLVKDNNLGSNIYAVKKDSHISLYNMKYQEIVDDQIVTLIDSTQDMVVIYNPYGTNLCSVNIYLKEEYNDVKYTITTSNKKIGDFSRNLLDKEKDYYQLIGLVPGSINTITLEMTNENGDVQKNKFKIDLTDLDVNSSVIIDSEKGKSSSTLENGLYAILGNDSDESDYVSLYDNDGILRSEIPIIGYRAHNILFNDDKMYFSISQTKIAEINNMGKVERIFKTGKYQLHHDYTFDNDGNILVLANNTEKSTEEDCIIKIDINTMEISEVIDFEDMFKSYVKTCTLDTKSVRDEGEDGLDWLHLNSIEYVDGDVILSSRETSSIIRVNNILDNPQLEYILGSEEFWSDTDFSSYVYKQKGNFKIHAGQHSVRYIPSSTDDVYYLAFFNNNYGVSNSKPSFDYSTINIDNNNPFSGDKSYYYLYKVDESEKTFELVDSFDVVYSGIVSSVQTLDNSNILVDSGTAGVFAEYDKNHKLIKKFTVELNKYMVYRVLKYDFNDFWFK